MNSYIAIFPFGYFDSIYELHFLSIENLEGFLSFTSSSDSFNSVKHVLVTQNIIWEQCPKILFNSQLGLLCSKYFPQWLLAQSKTRLSVVHNGLFQSCFDFFQPVVPFFLKHCGLTQVSKPVQAPAHWKVELNHSVTHKIKQNKTVCRTSGCSLIPWNSEQVKFW